MSVGETAGGIAAGMALADMVAGRQGGSSGDVPFSQFDREGIDEAVANTRILRKEVRQLNERLGLNGEDYLTTMARYKALAERFKEGRGDLLGTYRSKLAYRKVAHNLSGKSYEEIDAAAQEVRKDFDSDVQELRATLNDEDTKAGL